MTRASLAVEQYAGECKVAYRPLEHSIGRGERPCTLSPLPRRMISRHNSVGEPRFDTVAQAPRLKLEAGTATVRICRGSPELVTGL